MWFVPLALAASDVLGPLPTDTTLRGVEEHDEYERWRLHTDRDFVIELTRAVPGSGAICSGGGVDLWVRLDESAPGESFVWNPLPAIVGQACGRLEAHAPRLRERVDATGPLVQPPPPATPQDGPAEAAAPAWAAVSWLAAATALGGAWVLARAGRWPILLALAAFALRLAVSPRTVLLGGDAAFERLNALRLPKHSALYGDGYPALLGPLARLTDVHVANLFVSALAPAFAMVLLRRYRAPPAAAILVAILPTALALAGMEDAFVVVGTLQLLALAGPPIVMVLATALLAYTRPEQAVFALLPLGLLVRERRWPFVLALIAASLPRWIELVDPDRLQHAAVLLQPSRVVDVTFLRSAPWIALDPARAPFVLLPFAAWGAWKNRKLGALVALAILVGLAPVLTKTFPLADPLRFQLASVQWLALLAGVGVARAAWLGVPLTLLACWFARDPLGGPWAWQSEYDWLRVNLPKLSPDQDLWIDTSQDPNRAFRGWIDDNYHLHVLDRATAVPPSGAIVYRGTADAIAGSGVGDLVPIEVTTIPSATDGWVDLGTEPLTIGFYRTP